MFEMHLLFHILIFAASSSKQTRGFFRRSQRPSSMPCCTPMDMDECTHCVDIIAVGRTRMWRSAHRAMTTMIYRSPSLSTYDDMTAT